MTKDEWINKARHQLAESMQQTFDKYNLDSSEQIDSMGSLFQILLASVLYHKVPKDLHKKSVVETVTSLQRGVFECLTKIENNTA